MSLTGQLASVDEDLTGRENLILIGRLLGLRRRRRRTRADELLDAFGLSDAAGRLVKNFSGGMRRRLDIAASIVVTPRAHVPRRADHRAGPALAQPGLGHHPRARRGGHDDPAVHPVPRGGRPARRPDRRHRPRQGHRRGHARASSRRRSGPARCTCACSTPSSAPRPSACSSASSARSPWSPTRPRCRPRAPTPTAPPRRSPSSRAPACGSPASRSASRASTRSSSRSPAARPRSRRDSPTANGGAAGMSIDTDHAAPASAPGRRGRGPAWRSRRPRARRGRAPCRPR